MSTSTAKESSLRSWLIYTPTVLAVLLVAVWCLWMARPGVPVGVPRLTVGRLEVEGNRHLGGQVELTGVVLSVSGDGLGAKVVLGRELSDRDGVPCRFAGGDPDVQVGDLVAVLGRLRREGLDEARVLRRQRR